MCGRRPSDGGCFGIVSLDEGLDYGNEVLGADDRAAADLTLDDEAEPAVDLVEPRRIGRREMDMKTAAAWPARRGSLGVGG